MLDSTGFHLQPESVWRRTSAHRARPWRKSTNSKELSEPWALAMTSIYDIFKNSAMRKAAAPSTGGEMIAPIPPAASNPPADSLSYPALERSGQEAERRVTLSPRPNLTARREGTMPESPCVPPPPAYRWSLTEKSRHRTARPLNIPTRHHRS